MTNNNIILEDLEYIYNSDINWTEFNNSTILITGANGFLPAYLVEIFLYINFKNPTSNVKVLALVRNMNNAKNRFFEYLNNKNLEFIPQNVSESIEIEKKVDYIIHAASQASPKFYGSDPVGTLSANILGTINLLNFARKQKVKSFLFFSSSEVYGEFNEGLESIDENMFGFVNPINVRSCYAESKKMGENICISYFHQFQVPTKIVRPFHTYGPKMKLDDGRVYADFVSNILNNKDLQILSDGMATRAFCYISDATVGFIKVLLSDKNGEAYNIGNTSQQYTVFELAQAIVGIYPEKKLKVNISKRQDQNYLISPVKKIIPNITKMKISLNWLPQIDVIKGFERTIDSYR